MSQALTQKISKMVDDCQQKSKRATASFHKRLRALEKMPDLREQKQESASNGLPIPFAPGDM
eukprot:11867900-Karenia_brevis.AAC.1